MDGPSEPAGVCHNCGTDLHQSDHYCPSCGTAVGQEAGRTATESPDTEPTVRETAPRPSQQSQEWTRDQPAADRKSSPGAPGSKAGRESPFRAIGTAVGLSVAGLGVPLIGISLVGAALIGVGLPTGPVLVAMALLQFGWFIGLGLWYLRRRGYDWATVRAYLGVDRPTLKELGLILVTWVGMMIVAAIVGSVLVQFAAEAAGAENAQPAENSVGDIIEQNPQIVFAAIAGMFLVVGPAEELLFRGVIQNRLRETLSTVPAIGVASMLFASAHVFALAGGGSAVGVLITVSVLFVTSLGLGWIYEYTENIVVPALLHGFHNSVVVVATAAAATAGASTGEAILRIPELTVLLVEAL